MPLLTTLHPVSSWLRSCRLLAGKLWLRTRHVQLELLSLLLPLGFRRARHNHSNHYACEQITTNDKAGSAWRLFKKSRRRQHLIGLISWPRLC